MPEVSWALTVPQPAAWAIANGRQDVYNRSYPTDRRGWIAICAGSGTDTVQLRRASEVTGHSMDEIGVLAKERNMVVAVARLADVCDADACDCGPWADKRFVHWMFTDAVPLAEPVPAPHFVGIWKMPPEIADAVALQWRPGTAPPVPLALRDELLPLPGAEEGYRRVLLLGTTGAGKTTVVRQLLGTDPDTERFPSTSTAKTTVADTEIVLTAAGPYRAAVTFAGRDEIVAQLRDNVWEAARAVLEERPEDVVQNRLLDHISQRFRFSYLLGRAAVPGAGVGDDDDDVDDDALAVGLPEPATDPGTTELVQSSVRAIRHLVRTQRERIDVSGDERAAEEVVEDELETRVRRSEVTDRIVGALLAAIKDRFLLLNEGELRRDESGWPVSWVWESTERAEFLRVIGRFSSNQAAFFGHLLTPLVNGIRTAGPFRPLWAEQDARLVLIDGEGLGHTPGSIAEVSTPLRKRLDEVDSIVLVDNAQQPMQAAPVAVMRTAAATGNGEKLFFLFTHFDLVRGDNLRSFGDRERHVLGSAENVLSEVREELGLAERVLRRRLDEARFFVGGIDRLLAPDRIDPERPKASRRTVRRLNALLNALTAEAVPVETGPSRPVYQGSQVTDAVIEAVQAFHLRWRGTLGHASVPDVPRKHWASIKALTRRLAEGHTDEYQDLRPAASLRTALEYALYRTLQNPVRWTGPEPAADEQEVIVGEISGALTKRLVRLVDRLITEGPRPAWTRAYEEHGKGSTVRRARILVDDVFEHAVPRPLTGTPYDSHFTQAVQAALKKTATDLNVVVLGVP